MKSTKENSVSNKIFSSFLLLLTVFFSSASYSQSYPISIRPPITLTLDGQSISQGIFNLSGVTVFSEDAGVANSQIILDPLDPSDDVQRNPAIIGSTSTSILVSVPDDSEVLIMEGYFDAVSPDLAIARFKIILGAISPDGIPEFVWYLPTTTSNPTYTQISSVNRSGLSDNQDLFTLLGTTVTLINNDPLLPNHNFTPLNNPEVSNTWYVATPDSTSVPGAVSPLPANAVPVQRHGFSGCLGIPPVTSIAWLGGSGSWFSSNWDLDYGPDNGVLDCDYRVTVNDGTVSVSTSPTVNTLEIGADAEIVIEDGVDLMVVDGLFGNEGTLRFSSAGTVTGLSITNNSILSGATGNFVFAPGQIPTNQRLELNGNSLSTQPGSVHTFRNDGSISGSSVGIFANNGTVRTTGGQFQLDALEFVNNGTLTTLGSGDELVISNSELIGGVLSVSDGSRVIADGATFNNVTKIGVLEVSGSSFLSIENTFSNTGEIEIAPNGFASQLIIGDEVTLNGAGSIVFFSNNSTIEGSDGFFGGNGVPDELTIAPGASQLGRVQLI